MSATVYAFSNGSLFDTCGFGVYHDQTLPAARSAQSRPLLHDITNVKVHSSEALASRCTDWRLAQFISMLRCSAHPHLLSPGRCSLTLRRRLALLSVHQPSRSYIVAAASTHAKAAADPLPSQASAAPTSEPQAAPAKAALRIQEASQAIGGVLLANPNTSMPCNICQQVRPYPKCLSPCVYIASCSMKASPQNTLLLLCIHASTGPTQAAVHQQACQRILLA